MITPALLEIADDCSMKGAPKEVYLYLHRVLDYGEYRAVKLWPLAQRLRIDKANVGRAMRRLCEAGYLLEGERQRPGGRTYLLLFSRRESLKVA